MFIPNLGEHVCARCLLPIHENANYVFILETGEHGEASFCYECGVLEQHQMTEESLESLDKKWREYFKMENTKMKPYKGEKNGETHLHR